MSKWSFKFVCQYFVMIQHRQVDRNIYGSHQNNELSRLTHAGRIKHCFYMLHKGAYKVHLISGSLILQKCSCDHICLTDIMSRSFILSLSVKNDNHNKNKMLLFKNGNVYQSNFILLLKLAGCFI